MARPTDYKEPDTLVSALDYLKNFEKEGDVIPTIEGLAFKLDVARKTIYDWASQEDKKEFCNIVEQILSFQAKTLVNKGLTGDFNSNIAKLMLTKHGYSDKQDITSGGEKLETPIIPLNVSRDDGDKKDNKPK